MEYGGNEAEARGKRLECKRFFEGNKPVQVSCWIDSVSDGYAMAVSSRKMHVLSF